MLHPPRSRPKLSEPRVADSEQAVRRSVSSGAHSRIIPAHRGAYGTINTFASRLDCRSGGEPVCARRGALTSSWATLRIQALLSRPGRLVAQDLPCFCSRVRDEANVVAPPPHRSSFVVGSSRRAGPGLTPFSGLRSIAGEGSDRNFLAESGILHTSPRASRMARNARYPTIPCKQRIEKKR